MKKKLVIHEGGFKREGKDSKVDYTLIPTSVLTAIAKHYTDGAKVHGRDNWKKSTDMETFKQSAFRHLISALEGKKDENHIIACIWNLMALEYNDKK